MQEVGRANLSSKRASITVAAASSFAGGSLARRTRYGSEAIRHGSMIRAARRASATSLARA